MMKKSISIIFILTTILVSSASAVDTMITVSPLGFIWGKANIELSGVVSDSYTSSANESSAWALRAVYAPICWYGMPAVGGGASYRGYFNPTALAGPYWGLGIDFMAQTGTYSSVKYNGFFVIPRLELGYFFVAGGIVIGVYGYIGYGVGNYGVLSTPAPTTPLTSIGFDYGFEVKLGVGW